MELKAFKFTKNSHFLLSSTFLGAFAKLRKTTINCVMTVRPSFHLSAWYNAAPTERIFMKFDIEIFFESLLSKFKVLLKSDKDKGYLSCEGQYIFLNISRSVLLRMKNVSGKHCSDTR